MKYLLDETVFDTIDTEEKAYWLGFIWADGSVYINTKGKRNDHRLTIRINKKDEEHLHKFRQFINTYKQLKEYKDGTVGIIIDNKHIALSLKNLGIYSAKSFQDEFLYEHKIPVELWIHFWRGNIDGDGWIKASPKAEVGICGNIGTVLAFKQFCINILDFETKVKIFKRTERCVSFQITSLKARQLLNFLYKNSNVYLKRKFDKAKEVYDITTSQKGGYKQVLIGRNKLLINSINAIAA